ncbi:hypothetical protein FA95DRAFT_956364 [Auriscalpium vulgare]|uniref:Uncharacterized protein n=1 Tax=Auriscalpium vulgare TaxID=40419 RepID=A0ACB8R7E7_9AGAM|nr:hypothetical protein FA95DRAFT_956364 [Auriscalpium vulgare]
MVLGLNQYLLAYVLTCRRIWTPRAKLDMFVTAASFVGPLPVLLAASFRCLRTKHPPPPPPPPPCHVSHRSLTTSAPPLPSATPSVRRQPPASLIRSRIMDLPSRLTSSCALHWPSALMPATLVGRSIILL